MGRTDVLVFLCFAQLVKSGVYEFYAETEVRRLSGGKYAARWKALTIQAFKHCLCQLA